jgi:hypothetical protein
MTADVQPPPNWDKILNGPNNHDISDEQLAQWDRGVFINELHKQGLVFQTAKDGTAENKLDTNKGLAKGTYQGTLKALTGLYGMVEEAYVEV